MMLSLHRYEYACWYLLLVQTAFALSSSTGRKVAVIGATGRLGREVVIQLSQRGIPTRCLLRHDVTGVVDAPKSCLENNTGIDTTDDPVQIASYLKQLPGVEMVKGDINDAESLMRLLDGYTDSCLALHGPSAPKPIWKALFFPSIFYPEDTTPSHPKQLNYVGMQKLIDAIQASSTCQRLVRVTGKGESPWSFFSILINVFGGLAKGWNYEGEQLLRKSSINYTIVRPGILKQTLDDNKKSKEDEPMVLGLKDNGQDMKVTTVSYSQIADLIIQSLDYPNCQRATLTVMNVPADSPEGATTYGPLLQKVQPDSRSFPESLIQQHRRAARVGGLAIMGGMGLLLKSLSGFVWKLLFRS